MTAPPDLVVVQRVKEWSCAECGVRHEDTAYDELLMSVAARDDAREQIKDTIALILRTWA
jgi:hypothetical protein